MTIMTDKKKTILEAVEKLTDTYRKEELFMGKDRERLPNKKEIINSVSYTHLMNAIEKLKDEGIYPQHLWKD